MVWQDVPSCCIWSSPAQEKVHVISFVWRLMKTTASRKENNTPVRSSRRQDTAPFYDGECQWLSESVIWTIAIVYDRDRGYVPVCPLWRGISGNWNMARA